MLNRSVAPEIHEFQNFVLPQTEVKPFTKGGRVHYLQNDSQPVLRCEFVFPAGKWFETVKGASYFTSKLILEGTKTKTAKQIADILDFYGASLECNQGFDWATLTLYSLSRHFEALWPLVMEILTEPAFPEKEFELLKKRTAQNILVEKKKPAYLAMEKFSQNIFGKNHPYATGLESTEIDSLPLDEVKQFYKKHYDVGQAEVFVCGEISNEVKESIEIFCNKSATLISSVPENPEHHLNPNKLQEKIAIPGSLQAAVRIGGTFPLINHPDYIKLSILNKALGGYFGSRLMKNIREDKGFTYGIYSALSPRKHATLFYIGTEVNASKADETIIEINKEIDRLNTELLPENELKTVKNYIIGKFLSETNTVFDQMDRYKHLIIHELPLDYFTSYFNSIHGTTSLDLQELSSRYLVPANFHQVTAGT